MSEQSLNGLSEMLSHNCKDCIELNINTKWCKRRQRKVVDPALTCSAWSKRLVKK